MAVPVRGQLLFVTVGGCCGWLSLFAVWLLSVIVCVVGGGKEKRGCVMLPNKCCLLFITNK